MLRLRERRWLDGASFEAERGSTSRECEAGPDRKGVPTQSPVSLGEDLQWWPDKVGLPAHFPLAVCSSWIMQEKHEILAASLPKQWLYQGDLLK